MTIKIFIAAKLADLQESGCCPNSIGLKRNVGPSVITTLAVIIPARNEAGTIRSCIDSVFSGTLQPDEVVVVDGASTDETREVVRAIIECDPRVRLLNNPARTIPSAMNIGWQGTECDLIVRVDAHAQISADYLLLARTHLMTGEWQGVGGRKIPVATTKFGKAVAAAMNSRWGVGNSRYHYAGGIEEAEHVPFGAYPRKVIEGLGGWNETVLVNEDFEFDYRIRQSGGKILFDSAMSSRWACSSKVSDLAYQYHRYGKGKVMVARMHPASLRLRHLAPPVVAAGLLIASGAALFLNSRLAQVGIVAYLAAMASTALFGQARTLPLSERIRFPLAVFIMHNAWGVGFLRGVFDQLRGHRDTDSFKLRHFSFDEIGHENNKKRS